MGGRRRRAIKGNKEEGVGVGRLQRRYSTKIAIESAGSFASTVVWCGVRRRVPNLEVDNNALAGIPQVPYLPIGGIQTTIAYLIPAQMCSAGT